MKPFYQKLVTSPTQSVIFYDEEKPHFTVPWHFHPEIEILYVVRSSGICYTGDGIHRFTEGEISIIGENVPHWWKSDSRFPEQPSRSGIRALIIQFKKEIFESNFINLYEMSAIKALIEKSQRGVQFTGRSRQQLGNLIRKIFRSEGIERITGLIKLLDMMAKSEEFKYHSSLGYSKIISSYDFFRFNAIHEYIITNFTKDVRLEDVAGKANMCPTAFCRYFKKHTGRTFISFINELRIGNACKLMVEEKYPVNIASAESGFNNLAHFNKMFKRYFNLSPTDYLRAHDLDLKAIKEYSEVGIISRND
ncbi:MAG: AraC family transcriptional regulator [Bacteroidia bacterium]|nr:AraC family transcriptional regulator [Bacteroidia bacterium]